MASQQTNPSHRLGTYRDDHERRLAERLQRAQDVIERSNSRIRHSQQLLANCHGQNLYLLLGTSRVLGELLTAAIDVSGADFGNIQLFDSTDRVLRIVAQHGFRHEFLEHFAKVRDSDSACGVAMTRRSRVTVSDVASDTLFQGRASGRIVLQAEVRSLQSTPLVDALGRFVGVLSTHYHRPRAFSDGELQCIDSVIEHYLPALVHSE